MLYELVKNNGNHVGVSKACDALGVTPRWYRTWMKHEPPRPDLELVRRIHEIAKSPRYGYRRVTAELRRGDQPIFVNGKKVLNILRAEGLTVKKHVFRVPTTDSNHGLKVYPNLNKKAKVTALNQVWVADITYIRLPKGFAYLASILDRHSRKCVGWALGRTLEAQLAVDALRKAFECRQGIDLTGLIHHSDRGVQYASLAYVAELQSRGILPSMSAKGNPYENAFAESFNKTIKVEEVYLSEYESFEDAFRNIEHFIEEVYNTRRLHSSIGYMPPDEFEQQFLSGAVA
jgi:transposase InsO family protein